MQSPGRDPSMEDILASIKKVIQEEKDLRGSINPLERSTEDPGADTVEEDILELDEPIAPTAFDLGPPLVEEGVAEEVGKSFEQLGQVAAAAPAGELVNPLEEMVRDMLRPVLKQWVDEHLPRIVDEHVKREIGRITGRKL